MHFRLDDGKPVWAIATTQVERETLDEQGQQITVTETIYLYDVTELDEHPGHVLLDPPTSEILARAAAIEGKTLSKTEFERLLTEKTLDELIQEQNAQLLMANAQNTVTIQAQQQQIAALLMQIAHLQGGGA